MSSFPSIPQSLDEAIIMAQTATKNALDDGLRRLQVELVFPEIALKAQMIAKEFADFFADYGTGLKIIFPDTGAAALARRDWGETDFKVMDLGSRLISVETKVSDDDQLFLVVCPSSVEVEKVEKLCNLVGDRPVILLTPQLEDVSVVGIGYAARQLRERFLSILDSIYYIRPLEGAMVYRNYPSPWLVLKEKGEEYELIAQENKKPMGEYLDQLLNPVTENNPNSDQNTSKKSGFFNQVTSFLKALNQ
jgi:hypothetical protein